MALRHRKYPIHGVQFHPESIMTREGHHLLRNFLKRMDADHERTMNISGLLEKLMRRENLSVDEAAEAMAAIMSGEATPAQIGALLVGLTMKGERPAEIVGLARTMRANAVQLSKTFDDVFDTCGTGGDRSGTFNISSAAALVAAAAGLRVAKHGNRSVSSQCGSADVYEALGVNVAAAPAVVERSLESVGIAFFFAPTFHPSMRHAAPVRRELARADGVQSAGTAHEPRGHADASSSACRTRELTELMARALLLLGSDRAWVVHGADGIDEMSTTGHTKVSECRNGAVSTFYVHPSDFGIAEGRAQRSSGRRRRHQCRDRSRGPRRTRRDPAATSCCSTPAHRCSSAERPPRCAKASSAPRRPSTPARRVRTLDAMIAASKWGRMTSTPRLPISSPPSWPPRSEWSRCARRRCRSAEMDRRAAAIEPRPGRFKAALRAPDRHQRDCRMQAPVAVTRRAEG